MKCHTYYYDSYEDEASRELYLRLMHLMTCDFTLSGGFVLFCIGTDRITGDSLGPLVGYKIKKMGLPNIFVYGTLSDPVHALNMEEKLSEVQRKHPGLPVIAVDASLGTASHLGCVTICKGALNPGIGVKKKLKKVGDISITGIVCVSSPLANMQLQTTRLSTVMQLADCICESLLMAADSFRNYMADALDANFVRGRLRKI